MNTPTMNYHQSVFEAQIDKTTVESTREITFVIASEATGKQHRNRFLYNWDNWEIDSFNSNPIVGYQHNVWGDNMCSAPNPDDVIAKAEAWIDTFRGKKSLMSRATFEPPELNQTADKVFRKILNGSLNASSTGILPIGQSKTEVIKNDKNEVTDYFIHMQGQTLVEWSVVNIPADANALRRSFKSHTLSALSFVQRHLPNLSMDALKSMKVQDVIDAIEGKVDVAQLEIELKTSGADPELSKYIERLNKLKNGQAKS